MSRPEKILMRGVNWLGDAVMTTPALQRLREAKPDAHITLLTHEKLSDLWRQHPSIDEALPFAANESVWSIWRRLRTRKFDLAIVFPNSPRSALEVFLARIPERIGYRRAWRSFLLSRPIGQRTDVTPMRKRASGEIKRRIAMGLPRETFPANSHHVHDYLHLVAAAGAAPAPCPPLLRVNEDEVRAFAQRFSLTQEAPLFGLNAGAEYGPAKRWPRERFVAAAAQLQKLTGCKWLLFGGMADRGLTAEIARELSPLIGASNVVNLAGELSLRELCAGLKACRVVLTNDTGPMHVAAAVGTPVVVPFGSTSPELTGPSFVSTSSHRLLIGEAACAPCFRRDCPVDFRCMKSISVEQVVKNALVAWEAPR